MTTVLKISSVDTSNNAMQKSLGCANPAASNYVLKNFAQQLNGLTTNTFVKAERIDTEDITNATQE